MPDDRQCTRRSANDCGPNCNGPEPGEDGNPVARVCIAIAARDAPAQGFACFYEDREAIRRRAVADALAALMDWISISEGAQPHADRARAGECRSENRVRRDIRLRRRRVGQWANHGSEVRLTQRSSVASPCTFHYRAESPSLETEPKMLGIRVLAASFATNGAYFHV
jgi:hypothetical protein